MVVTWSGHRDGEIEMSLGGFWVFGGLAFWEEKNRLEQG